MANEVSIKVTATDDASKTFDGVATKAKGLGSALGDVGKVAGGIVLSAGILKAPDFFMSAAKAAADDAASVARVEQAFKNAGAPIEEYHDSLLDTIAAGQKLGFSDDQTRDSLALLVAQTGDAGEAFRRYSLAQDLARGANIDVVTASKLLGKVTDENVNVLARYGIKVEKGASETELFGKIYEKFHGQAQTFADSTAGKMARFQDSMGELKETIGYAVLPVMTKMADLALTKLMPALQKLANEVGPVFGKVFKEIGSVFKEIESVIGDKVLPAFNKLGDALKNLQHLFNLGAEGGSIGGQFSDIQKAAFTLGQVFTQNLKPAFEDAKYAIHLFFLALKGGNAGGDLSSFQKTLLQFGKDVRKVFEEDVKPALNAFMDIVRTVVKDVADHWDTIKTVFMFVLDFTIARIKGFIQEVKGIVEVVSGVVQLIDALIHGRWAAAWEALKQIAKGALDVLIGEFKAQFGNLPNILMDAAAALLRAARDLGQNIIDGIINALRGLPGAIRNAMSFDISGAIWAMVGVGLELGRAVINGAGEALKDIGSKVANWLSGAISSIEHFLGLAHEAANTPGPNSQSNIYGNSSGQSGTVTGSSGAGSGGTASNAGGAGASGSASGQSEGQRMRAQGYVWDDFPPGEWVSPYELSLRRALRAPGGAFALQGPYNPVPEPRALGGPVRAGWPYKVGERGTETFVPDQSGIILPHGAGGGGPSVVVNVHGSIVSERDLEKIIFDALRRGGFRGLALA